MICLCYNKDKGLFIEEEKNVKKDEIVIKSHEKKGIKMIKGNYPIGDLYIRVDSNFGYGRNSYLCVLLYKVQDGCKRYILNFDEKLHNHRGMRSDSVSSFFFNPESTDKWTNVFNFIIDIYNEGELKPNIGSYEHFHTELCKLLEHDTAMLKQNYNVLLSNSHSYGTLSYRCCDLISSIKHSLLEKNSEYKTIFQQKFLVAALSYVSAINCYFLANEALLKENQYRILRIFANEISKFKPELGKSLSALQIRKIDHCYSLTQIRNTQLWFGQYEEQTTFMSLVDKDNDTAVIYPIEEKNTIEGKWVIIDNEKDEFVSTQNGEYYFSVLLPSKDPDDDIFTLSTDDAKFYVAKLISGKLENLRLNDIYDSIGGFYHNAALVSKDELYGIIDVTGHEIVPVKYSHISNFYKSLSDIVRLDMNGEITQESLAALRRSTNVNLIEKEGSTTFTKNDNAEIIPLVVPIKEVFCVNFKRFEKLKNLPINQINFIVGPNNAGKSTYIELIELLMHNIPLLDTTNGFKNLINYLVLKSGVNGNKEIWLKQGSNNIELVTEHGTIICDINTNLPYKKTMNNRHVGDNINMSMKIGNITFEFSLNELEKYCFIDIHNSHWEFKIYGEGSEIGRFELFHDGEKVFGPSGLNKYNLDNIENFCHYLLKNGFGLQEDDHIATDKYKEQESELCSFFCDLRTSIQAATEVRHIEVWNGKFDFAYCRSFFDDSLEDNTCGSIINFVSQKRQHVSKDEILRTVHKITDAREELVIPFINKWLQKMEIGESFTLHHDFGDAKILCNIRKSSSMISIEEVNEIISKRLSQIADDLILIKETELNKINCGSLNEEIETIYIENKDGVVEDIRTKGTGVQHFVSLLFTISRIMLENILRDSTLPVLLVEEPEQNLHPKLQSLLADFFMDIASVQKSILQKYGMSLNHDVRELQIIVETHSEYIIRKVQVLVAEKKYQDEEELKAYNPFEIFYFPQSDSPYNMGWNKYGRFLDCFDDGFFNVSSKDAIKVSKLERTRQ